MKKSLMFIVAIVATLSVADANAQLFRRSCVGGACQYRQLNYAPSYSVAPCEASTIEPCEPVSTVQPCEPVQTNVPPCEPVQTVEPCEPVAECVNGACPIQTSECVGGACPIQTSECVGGACPLRAAAKTVVAKTFETLALARINATRAMYGRPALRLNRTLESRAYYQAQYCASIGGLRHASGVAEILAQSSSFDGAIGQWLSSAPHCALMLNTSFTEAGAAFYTDAYGRVWCAVQFR
ncbi:MAG: hypothetical protein IJL92_04540 [Thermoguttaceae bacterium]|nr:hypothetical protein [Thermoguttaceae bacterium]